MDWKRVAKGTGAGLGISIGGYLLGRHLISQGNLNGIHVLDAGQRIGSIASAKYGGWMGNAVYQGLDYVIDRFISPRTSGQLGSGTSYI